MRVTELVLDVFFALTFCGAQSCSLKEARFHDFMSSVWTQIGQFEKVDTKSYPYNEEWQRAHHKKDMLGTDLSWYDPQ